MDLIRPGFFSIVTMLDRFIPGIHTCDQLYGRSLNGNIPDQICKPLVDFDDSYRLHQAITDAAGGTIEGRIL
jgi:hypothetical protein